MKRRKILVLIPMLGLFLTGCTFQEGFATAKHWVGQNIYHPAKDFIEGLIGKKDSKEEEQPKEDDKPTPTPTPTEKTLVSVAVKDAPKKVEQGGTIDKSKVKLTATYSEGDPEEVTAEEVVCDTSKVAKEVEAVAKYKGKEAKFTIEVTEKSTPVETEWKKLTAQPEVGKTYALILDREEASSNPGLWFLTGKTESEVKDGGKDYYLATSQSEDDAAAVQVIAGEGGFKVKIGTRYLAMFETENNNKKYTNVGLKESESDATVLTYDETIGFYGVFNTDKNYGLGTRNDQAYTTVGAVDFSTHPENYKACLYSKEEVVPVTPTVTSVTISPSELALTVGLPDGKLTAEVVGENNPSTEVTWHSDNEEAATVSNGSVHAVGEGTAHITATSVVGGVVSNQCTVTVTQPAVIPTVESVVVSGTFKTVYTEGEKLNLDGMIVTVHYSNNTDVVAETGWTTNIELTHELTSSDTSLIVSYDSVPATAITLTINPASSEKGSFGNPYTVHEALEAIDSSTDVEGVHAVGYVSKIVNDYSTENKNITFDISADGYQDGEQLRGFRTVGTTEYPIAASGDIQLGDKVILKGNLTKYGSTYEFDSGNELVFKERIENPTPIGVEILSTNQMAPSSELALSARVAPYGSSQAVTWSIVSGSQYGTLNGSTLSSGASNGVIRVRATAVGHENVYGELDISVDSSIQAALAAYVMNGGAASTTALTADQVKANFFNTTNCTGTNIVSAVTTATKLYPDEGPSLKFASSSAKGELGLTLSESISRVVLRVKAYNHSDEALSILVGGKEVAITKNYTEVDVTLDAATTSFTLASKIATKNRFYVTNISFYK